MENKVKVWIVRDKDNSLCAYPTTPFREDDMWFCDEPIIQLDSSLFPSVKWEDAEPTEAYITLAEPQEQPKQDIDWEQRRYEIVKDLISLFATKISTIDFIRQEERYADFAIHIADALIKELKTYPK